MWPNDTDPILEKYADQIKSFAYVTFSTADYMNKEFDARLSDPANLFSHRISVRACTPSPLMEETL